MITSREGRHESGVALVITLIILVLLAGMAVALLQTASFERGTSSSIAARTKSDLAAQAAVDAAIASLVDTITLYPDSATTWETINGNEGTVLYYNDKTPEQAINGNSAAQTYVFPLASGGTVQKLADKNNSIPVLTDTAAPPAVPNAYNLNHARSKGDTQGWIGSPKAAATPYPFRGQWIDLTENRGTTPSITGRYAYWMEDESFKANANYMTNNKRGQTSLGRASNEIPFQGVIAAAASSNSSSDTIADAIVNYRNFFPNGHFFNYRDINQVNGQPTLADDIKFETTIFSGGLNLSRSGSKRVNLNAIVQNSEDPSAIRTQLDQIIKPIQQELPNFPQRFYRLGADLNKIDVTNSATPTSPSHQVAYLNKLAANIRDYIDSDSQPTIINNDAGLSIRIGAKPQFALGASNGGTSGDNEVVAIGKERVPYLNEYMLRVKQLVFDRRGPYPPPPAANYKVEIDHYVELWNMTDRNIELTDLGPNPFLRIANQFGWDAVGATGGGTNIPEGSSRDFSIPLSDFVNIQDGHKLSFPAGTVTVLTTDTASLPSAFTNVDPNFVFRPAKKLDDQFRSYTGITTLTNSKNYMRLSSHVRTASGDYETEIILGNDLGVIDSASQAAFITTISVDVDDPSEGKTNPDLWHFRGSRPNGNLLAVTPSETGDPRAYNEQLALRTTSDSDRTRYKAGTVDSKNRPGESTLTKLNSNFVDPSIWVDPSDKSAGDANHAPAVIANIPLVSIGELGNVYDPARKLGAAPAGSGDIRFSRGGGRTLKIGQPDDLWDRSSTSPSREWTAWRLLDVFGIDDSTQLDGLININGVNRDKGVAFKTALYGYQFLNAPDGDSSINGATLSDDQAGALVTQMLDRLNQKSPFGSTSGPFLERGELSEMPLFNQGSDLTGKDISKAMDRGREEVFRRLAQLITTRGNIFTVYAAGQALIPQPGGAPSIVASTSQLKVTFRLDPIWATNPQKDPGWDPSKDLSTRLAKPTRYVAHILYAGD